MKLLQRLEIGRNIEIKNTKFIIKQLKSISTWMSYRSIVSDNVLFGSNSSGSFVKNKRTLYRIKISSSNYPKLKRIFEKANTFRIAEKIRK